MPKKIYDRIVRSCFAVIVVSVLLADRFGEWQVISLVVALCAGVVAGGVYLYDQSRRHYQKKRPSVEKSHTPYTSLRLHWDLAEEGVAENVIRYSRGQESLISIEEGERVRELLRILREPRSGERLKGPEDLESWAFVISEGTEIKASRHPHRVGFSPKKRFHGYALVGKFAKHGLDENPLAVWPAHNVGILHQPRYIDWSEYQDLPQSVGKGTVN